MKRPVDYGLYTFVDIAYLNGRGAASVANLVSSAGFWAAAVIALGTPVIDFVNQFTNFMNQFMFLMN
jgi:hypothetical protein